MYDDKKNWYFNFVRRDIEPLLPTQVDHVMEIGCGAGATLAWLKQTGRAKNTVGLELMADAAEVARTRVDQVMQGPLEEWLPTLGDASMDLILCLDVLEHLVDPWETMKELHRIIKPGGQIIISLPNVRNHRVVLPLLFKGAWTYTDAGIMDRTHLRFFTRETAIALTQQGGFDVEGQIATGIRKGDKDYWRNLATFGLLSDLFTFQYLLKARKPAEQAECAVA